MKLGTKPSLLASYFYWGKADLSKYWPQPHLADLFADCGAFSAYHGNHVIDVAEYADWLLRWKHLFRAYANLDVIYNRDATAEHQKYLEGRGLSPLPVIHAGTDLGYVKELCQHYEYLCIGGVAKRSGFGATLHPWLSKVFENAGKARFHGFAVSDLSLLRLYPFWSVDSTSWKSGPRWGTLPIWDGHKGAIVWHSPRKEKTAILTALARNGVQSLDGIDGNKQLALGIPAYIEAQQYIGTRIPGFTCYLGVNDSNMKNIFNKEAA